MSMHLPGLIDRYRQRALRLSRRAGRRRRQRRRAAGRGLAAGRAALDEISEKLARADMAAFETQGRFIQSRYGEERIERLADDAGALSAVPEPHSRRHPAPQEPRRMLAQRGRRQVGIGALAVDADRRADQRHFAADRPDHLPRCCAWTSASAWLIVLIGPAGMPAASSFASHSAAGFWRDARRRSVGTISSRLATRAPLVAKRSSLAHSGWPQISASRANWRSLPTAMMIG